MITMYKFTYKSFSAAIFAMIFLSGCAANNAGGEELVGLPHVLRAIDKCIIGRHCPVGADDRECDGFARALEVCVHERTQRDKASVRFGQVFNFELYTEQSHMYSPTPLA